MKRATVGVAVLFTISLINAQADPKKTKGTIMSLSTAPTSIERYKEIAIQYNTELPDLFNTLKPEERVFVYYLYRASIPGNRIATDQMHRDGVELISLFESLYKNREIITNAQQTEFDTEQFMRDVETFLVYLWTNHGQYFMRETHNEKRTPARLGLATLTPQTLTTALSLIGKTNAAEVVARLEKTIFDTQTEASTTIANNIEQSAVNIYAPDFTESDFKSLPVHAQNKLNAYFCIEKTESTRTPTMIPYSTTGKYGEELSVAVHWFEQALDHAKKYPTTFDKHLTNSLEYLIDFLKSGDEELFKKHSIEWLKSSSKIDYNFGFIETYHDPKSYRGFFQAEATIKVVDINKLNSKLPAIEGELPFPKEFKRDTNGQAGASIPNASINNKIFGMGALGPMEVTAAYCLPNYEEIRATHGSKQIIYPASKGIAALLNPDLNRTLFHLKEEAEWLTQNDPDGQLGLDIWNVQCILHETIGHGSGKLAQHTFKDGENLTIAGNTYNVGDTIDVTNKNLSELLGGYEHTIEELRAEILALYVSVHNVAELLECDLLTRWQTLLTTEELEKHLILGMTGTGLRRMLQQSDGATEIAGDHARANTTIMNWMLDRGGIELVEERVTVNGADHTVVGLRVCNLTKAKESMKDLMILVQRIKSTGDGLDAQNLIETYGRPLRHPEHMTALKANRQAIIGDLKATAVIAPHLIAVNDKNGSLVDVKAEWPKNIFEQFHNYTSIELSKELV